MIVTDTHTRAHTHSGPLVTHLFHCQENPDKTDFQVSLKKKKISKSFVLSAPDSDMGRMLM